ncbi:ankyrin [Hypoxylon trugodes]|uniref:ankyrin n=1 Tax=Hypoxylon trugodes TaxID=326681 RepID=UPI00219D23B3|nr:ankyrin [Hypoxylon trugodes]KAI1394316.1 ankyrin [Hypoxylon trugodes]
MEVVGSVASIAQLIEIAAKICSFCATVMGASQMIDELGRTSSMMLQLLYQVKQQVDTDNTTRGHPLGPEDLIRELQSCMVNLSRQFEKLSPKGFMQKLRFVHMEKDIQKTIDKASRMNGLLNSWLTLDIKQTTKAIDDGVKTLNSHVEDEMITGRIDRLVKHYAPVSFSEKHGNVLQQRQDGTGQWFLDSPEFQEWMKSSGGTLWCSGAPGAGKTVMASTTIEYLRKKLHGSRTCGLAYVYCDYRQRQDQKASVLLGNIWAQLFRRRGPSATEVNQAFGEMFASHDFRPTKTQIINMIRDELTNSNLERIYVVVDALDECGDENERNGFIDGLNSLQPFLNILITSRMTHHDNAGFNDVRAFRFTPTNEDMSTYINARIRESKKIASYVDRKPELKEQIRRVVIDRANGMFLLCRMHLDTLSRAIRLKDLIQDLDRIPKGENVVKDTYDQAMERIRDQGTNIEEFALRVIRWVCFARRPLKLAELLCALAIEPGDEELDEDAVGDESDIANYCAGLVVVEGDSKTVRFVHYTTQEYFNSLRDTHEFIHSNRDIALSCISFLGLDDLTLPKGGYVAQIWPTEDEIPFFSYAALHLGHHCVSESSVSGPEESEESGEIMDLFLRFLKRPEYVERASIAILSNLGGRITGLFQDRGMRVQLPTKTTAASIAAFFDMIREESDSDAFSVSVEWLVGNTEQATGPEDSYFGNPLHWACLGNSTKSIEVLLNNTAIKLDVNSAIVNPVGWQPHMISVAYGSLGTLQALLNHGIDLYKRSRLERATNLVQEAIMAATTVKGPEKTTLIKAIMEKDAIGGLLVIRDVYGNTALMEAVRTTDFEVFECILGYYERAQWPPGLKENTILSFEFERRTALHWAVAQSFLRFRSTNTTATSGPLRILEALLDTPYGNGLLLRRDSRGDTPFESAIRHGYIQAVETILAKHEQHQFNHFHPQQVISGLNLAARVAKTYIVELLLGKLNNDLLSRPGEDNVLHYAARGTMAENTGFLLQKLAGLRLYDIPGSNGNLPLHYAAASGNTDSVEALLKQQGVSINARNEAGQTALHKAVDANLIDVCSSLLKAGANINIDDKDGLAPLTLAIKKRCTDILTSMIPYATMKPHNLDDDDISWLREQPWGDGLLQQSTNSKSLAEIDYWPQQEDDIVTAALCLRRKLRRGSSSTAEAFQYAYVVSRILDLAEYWVRSSAVRVSIDNDGEVRRWGDPTIPFLRSKAITGRLLKPVCRVDFVITSHDQGYCSDPSRGDSWTWFTADVNRRENSAFAQELAGPKDKEAASTEIHLISNRGADRQWHIHKISWSLTDPTVADAESGLWIKALTHGDRVVVLPYARFPGWENWIRRVRIDIFTTCLKNESSKTLDSQ